VGMDRGRDRGVSGTPIWGGIGCPAAHCGERMWGRQKGESDGFLVELPGLQIAQWVIASGAFVPCSCVLRLHTEWRTRARDWLQPRQASDAWHEADWCDLFLAGHRYVFLQCHFGNGH
jgi:hypothetical protein